MFQSILVHCPNIDLELQDIKKNQIKNTLELFKTIKSDHQNVQDSITVKFGDKEWFDKEQIGVKEPFPMTKCQFTS